MISWLEQDFEYVKEQFRDGSLLPIFAKSKIEKIVKDVDHSLSVLKTVNNNDSIKRRFIALKKQLQEFDEMMDAYLGRDQGTSI